MHTHVGTFIGKEKVPGTFVGKELAVSQTDVQPGQSCMYIWQSQPRLDRLLGRYRFWRRYRGGHWERTAFYKWSRVETCHRNCQIILFIIPNWSPTRLKYGQPTPIFGFNGKAGTCEDYPAASAKQLS